MTLILRPPGRGNWTPVVVTIAQSRHAPLPLEFHVGQMVDFGGNALRVVAVLGGG